MKVRHSLFGMMFFQLFAFGAINPLLSMYLQQYLHFTGGQTGIILAASVVSSLVSPLIAVYLIDRLISSRWLLILCHIMLALISITLTSVHDFGLFLILYAAFSVFAGPTIGLVNSITFQNLPEGGHNFGAIRVWGTVGWIAAGWLISGIWALLPLMNQGTPQEYHPLILVVAAIGSILTLILALALPGGPKLRLERREFIPPETKSILKDPTILVLSAVYLVSAILDRFYSYGTAPYLSALGLPETWIMPVMSLGQITEIVILFTLAAFLRRFKYGLTLLIGMGLNLVRFVLYCTGIPAAAIVAVSLNGFIFAWVYTTIIMYVDAKTTEKTRAGVHQIMNFVFTGVASLLGNLAAGFLSDGFGIVPGQASAQSWIHFWMVPSSLATVLLVITIFSLRHYRLLHHEKVVTAA